MNYKIKVGSEVESKEVQELLFELGYVWLSGDNDKFHHLKSPYLYTNKDMGLWCGDWHSTFNENGNKEISIDQLKDMVVLKRNDVGGEPKYDPEDIGIAKGYDLDELAKEYKFRDRYDGETDENYRAMLEQYISKESINDKVASAEVARQEFIGVPFSDLPEFNFGAVEVADVVDEPNVEQGAKHSHYKKDISHLDTLDIYRVTELFNPHSCGAHIAKKALCSGQRGHKDLLTDIQDIIDTAERWKEMLIEDEKTK